MKGSEWSGLEWSPAQTLGAETWKGGAPVAQPRMLPGGKMGDGGHQPGAHPSVRVRG